MDWPGTGAAVGGTLFADGGVDPFAGGCDDVPGCLVVGVPGVAPRGGTIGRGTPFVPGNGCPGPV